TAPGSAQHVAIQDVASQKLGSAMQFVEVPDVKSGRLALSGIVLIADPPSAADPDGTPAVRIFKSGGALAATSEKDATRLAVGGHAQLTKIPPGEYVMQLLVFDSLRKDKSRMASQAMDF